MNQVVFSDEVDVHTQLHALGLEQQFLLDVARRGYVAFSMCTPNDPPLYPGLTAWAQMVRALREYLLPKGWTRSDENSYSLVVSPDGRHAIAVATGDDGTGRADMTPTTKSSKGPSTVDAVLVNQSQLSLPFDFPPMDSDASPTHEVGRMTRILLVHRSPSETRCELSLPLSMGTDSRIDSWQERIILGSISLDPEAIEIDDPTPQLPDIDVEIKRRA